MTRLTKAFGRPLALLILMFSSLWILGLVAAPQVIMIEQSLWRMDRPVGSAEISVRIDGLYNKLDVLALDRKAVEAGPDTVGRTQKLEESAATRIAIEAEIAELEAKESRPVKVYTLSNFGQMGVAHLAIFLKTIVASLAVTVIALVVCYPIAFAVAKLETPKRAGIIMLALVIPYAWPCRG